MTVQLHPETDLLVDYAAGSLSPALCVSISAHLHFCDACRAHDSALSDLGGDLLSNITPEKMPKDALDKVLLSLDSPDSLVDSGEIDTGTHGLNSTEANGPRKNEEMEKLPAFMSNLIAEPEYSTLTRSLKVAKIPIGENQYELALHKISAGGKTPKHDHRGLEVTVVLYGSFSDLDGVYNEGDFIVRNPGDVHSPLATQDDECICLSVVEAPIRLVGPIMRVMNPFLSFNPA